MQETREIREPFPRRGAQACPEFVPNRCELEELAHYWCGRRVARLEVIFGMQCFDASDVAILEHAEQRLGEISEVLGDAAVREVVERAERALLRGALKENNTEFLQQLVREGNLWLLELPANGEDECVFAYPEGPPDTPDGYELVEKLMEYRELAGAYLMQARAVKFPVTSTGGIDYLNIRAFDEARNRRLALQNKAVEAYHEAAELAPEDANNWFALGEAYLWAGRVKEATWAYSRVIEIDPRAAFTHYQLGSCWEEQGEFSFAVEATERALVLAPGSRQFSTALARRKRKAEEIARCEAAISADPGDAEAYRNLGETLKYSDDDRAIRALKKAISLCETDYRAYESLGEIYYSQRKYRAALEEYEIAIRLVDSASVEAITLAAAVSSIRRYLRNE